MHPFFVHRAHLALYGLACLAAGAGLAALARQAVAVDWAGALAFALPLALLVGFALLAAWWVCAANPLVPGTAGRVALVQGGAALQSGAGAALVAAAWALALARGFGVAFARTDPLRLAALVGAVTVLLWLWSAIVHYLALAFAASRAAERRVLESQVAAREAELRALRAQLNPHFLFNSLNSINALVGVDPEGARAMCSGLGDFLRRTLALGARGAVTLAEELELVERYLAIEQVRFGERLRIERDVEPDALACVVPPLLLQPLIENAVKHGVAGRLEGGTVTLLARREDDVLRLVVENPVDADAPTPPGAGHGLENVRRRLDAFGARGATLGAERGEDWFRVELTLPASRAEEDRHGG